MIIATASAAELTTADSILAAADLPLNAPLYASAVDSSDESATFGFTWFLLRKPTGSTASLSANNVSNPMLNNIDVWGNYRLFLVATNTATGESSETDPLLAPSSAFTHVRITSEALGLQKPAAGERDWMAVAHKWVEELEDLGASLMGLTGFTWEIESGGTTTSVPLPADGSKTPRFKNIDGETRLVVTENTAELLELEIGIAANLVVDDTLQVNNEASFGAEIGVAGGNLYNSDDTSSITIATSGLLIKNATADVGSLAVQRRDVPTTTVRAGVLKESATGNANCKIMSYERFQFSDSVERTTQHTTGANNFTQDTGIAVTTVAGNSNSKFVCLVYNDTGYDLVIDSITATMNDIGKLGTGSEYVFTAARATNTAALISNTLTDVAVLSIDSARVDGAANSYVANTLSIAFNTKSYIGIYCSAAPQHLGTRLRFTVSAYREIV